MNTNDIKRLLKYIEDTKTTGKKIDDSLFLKMKDLFVEGLMQELASKDKEKRALANKLSKAFINADLDHKSRFLNKMASLGNS